MRRRDLLRFAAATTCAAVAERLATAACFDDSAPANQAAVAEDASKPQPLGLVINSYWVRRDHPLDARYGGVADPIDFVATAAAVGAAGVQTGLGVRDVAYVARLRETLERRGMYLECSIGLPADERDVPRFEAELATARQAGADIARSVCMNGRRYEVYDTRQAFRDFATRAWKSLVLAEKAAAKAGVRVAIENHKDWRVDEMLAGMERLSSEHVGVCVDTGNSVALLEEPHAVVEAYAKWALTTHLKDMAVAEYDDGFLLAETPLGEGFLDMPRIVATLRAARPEIRLNLEMITRDPLRVPCLTDKYWATLDDVPPRELARALARVRRHRANRSLPVISGLPRIEQLEVEERNIATCLAYARSRLNG